MGDKQISITLTEPYICCLDKLVDVGVYADRAEIVKDGLRRIFRSYGMKPFVEPLEETRGQ